MIIDKLLPANLFSGKTAFITGGGSGINLGIAKNFAALGANVTICSRNQGRLDAAALELRKLGAKVCTAAADVRDNAAVAAALAKSAEELGPADVVVSGAAGNFLCEAEKLSLNGFKTVVEIDLMGSFNVARSAFDQLKQTRGVIIFISAGLSWLPYTLQVHAGAAKAGIDNMMKNLALEWGIYGIRCNSIAPGYIGETEGTSKLAGGPVLEAVLESTPLGRLGTVDDIGQAAVFLASPLASFITGTIAVVDGGHYLGGSSLLNSAQRKVAAATASGSTS
ncbi:MAG: SDR family oxidoreductase [Burkholderiaceae bacterium]|jgi:NAD(P)-dependent dehydrogenase (short-subunit alcohol dehydrogenase family)